MPERETITAGLLALTLVWEGDRIAGLTLAWAKDAPTPTPALSPLAAALAEALQRLARGEPPRWPALPLDWDQVGGFTRRVLETLASDVGWGQWVTYGELAARAGRPGAARAAGRAMALNPWPLVVP